MNLRLFDLSISLGVRSSSPNFPQIFWGTSFRNTALRTVNMLDSTIAIIEPSVLEPTL